MDSNRPMKGVALERDEINAAVRPFFFDASRGNPLYGCLHVPQDVAANGDGVVICSPIGQEYIRSHRALYQLAVRLSKSGFHVLRFDYFGCGDSSGDFEEGELGEWEDNICRAIEIMQATHGCARIHLVGLRMGATLAAKAANRWKKVDSVVLWEPVIDGKGYLDDLAAYQQDLDKRSRLIRKKYFKDAKKIEDIAGYPITPELANELERIEPGDLTINGDVKVLMLRHGNEAANDDMYYDIERAHPQADVKIIQDHIAWMERVYKRLIPFTSIKYIVQWLT